MAVNVAVCPAQIVTLGTDIIGSGLTTTFTAVVVLQVPILPITLNVVVTTGLTTAVFVVVPLFQI